MFDKEFFKMAIEFILIVAVGLLLTYAFSNYVSNTEQIALPVDNVAE